MILVHLLLVSSLAAGQDTPPQSSSAEAPGSAVVADVVAEEGSSFEQRALMTLSALGDSRASKLKEIEALRAGIDPDAGSERRLEQLAKIGELQMELRRIEYDFESVASGIDVRAFDIGVDEGFDLIGEIEGLLKPIVSELRTATEAPREMERLRSAMTYAKEHQIKAKAAVTHMGGLIEFTQTATLDEGERAQLLVALVDSQTAWRERLRDLANQHTVAKFQLEKHEARQRSAIDSARTALGDFFRTKGLNVLLAVSVFLSILFGLRLVHQGISALVRKRSKGERKFYARLIDVLYFGFSGIAAMGGALFVLYTASDWAILGLTFLMLMGLGWAGKAAVPMFLEQIRLLLNLGTVREGERIVFQGLPWRVKRLSLNALLVNEKLVGGRLHVPLRDMTVLRSRKAAPEETWFPTSTGDWIMIDGETLARVVFQSTEIVQVELQGGSLVNYPTTEFLGLHVENLAQGFRIQVRFGVDYDLQAISTEEVPRIMRDGIESGLHRRYDPNLLRKLRVEILEAGASSIDYAVLADFEAEAAPRHNDLQRGIHRILIELCNEHGWGIPFTQITIHNA